jgi:hypothetical protein
MGSRWAHYNEATAAKSVAMPSPFPGMDPYLEHPDLWPEVHSRWLMAMVKDQFLGAIAPDWPNG